MRERITYYSDGLKLSGILSTPDSSGAKRFPGVVLVPGFMSTADAFFPGFAEELKAGGFVSLTMDFRGFGESEGVRGEVIPYLQIYDASNAISYLQSRPEVDPNKIAILGVSLGGGEVAYIAARDRRVKAVASMVLVGDGVRRMRKFRTEEQWQTLMQKVQEDRINRAVTGKSKEFRGFLKEGTDSVLIMPPDLTSSLKDAEQVEDEKGNSTTLATVDGWLAYKPEEIIDKVSPTPILFVQAEKDELEADDADILYRKAKEPKKLFTLKDGVHFDVYGKRTNEAMNPVLEWFKQHLQ
ncbi:MAG: alpha/beta hydrolase [Deltaproteobacteria bacterium]|nr:alpha/beta hydrolase [Deltaproteobacteria bacterium]